jgi:restriction system protein
MAAAGSKLRGTSQAKSKALRQLVRKRRSEPLKGYARIGDFCDGAYECEYVSPWTKSGCNLDAKVMVVGQDWASEDALGRPNPVRAHLGYNPQNPTNQNLDRRLREHLGLDRADCYLTNMFPFVKPGKKKAKIPRKHMEYCAREFTLEEVRIVRPRLVLCLGLKTFKAFSVAAGQKKPRNMDEAVNSPFEFEGSTVYCVAHVGSQGENTRNRGRDRDQVAADWQRIASFLRNVPSQPRVKRGAEKASSEK